MKIIFFRLCAALLLSNFFYAQAAYKEAYLHIVAQEICKNLGISQAECEKRLHNFYIKESRGCGQWMDSYHILPGLINKYNLSVGCEVGVSHGFHSYFILKNTQVTKLYSVDPYKHFSDGEYQDIMNIEQDDFDVLHLLVKARLSVFNDRTSLIRLTSLQAAAQFEKDQLDFVYIDGNHSYKAVKEDLQAWWDKVRSGGIVAGDDYNPREWPGVTKAVDEFFAEKGIVINHAPDLYRFYWVIKP